MVTRDPAENNPIVEARALGVVGAVPVLGPWRSRIAVHLMYVLPGGSSAGPSWPIARRCRLAPSLLTRPRILLTGHRGVTSTH
ncbi:hypothetical protein Misp05_60690 [Micromonospora sp. NBRC 107095]|nr:hypothetical protein Misp05_60690 [Micromonospora sp. NBRC 107095]